jgi:hypothetical protein
MVSSLVHCSAFPSVHLERLYFEHLHCDISRLSCRADCGSWITSHSRAVTLSLPCFRLFSAEDGELRFSCVLH